MEDQVKSGVLQPLKKNPMRLFEDIYCLGHCDVICEQFRVKTVRNTNNTSYGIQRVTMQK